MLSLITTLMGDRLRIPIVVGLEVAVKSIFLVVFGGGYGPISPASVAETMGSNSSRKRKAEIIPVH